MSPLPHTCLRAGAFGYPNHAACFPDALYAARIICGSIRSRDAVRVLAQRFGQRDFGSWFLVLGSWFSLFAVCFSLLAFCFLLLASSFLLLPSCFSLLPSCSLVYGRWLLVVALAATLFRRSYRAIFVASS
jgi:hypothetical protein